MSTVTRIAFIALAILFTLGCTKPTRDKLSKPVIVVSILPQKYFVERIADTLLRVEVLVPPGSSPEMFEPGPKQLKDLSNADLYFSVGLLDFERAMLPRLRTEYPDVAFVDLSEGISLLEGECSHHVEGHAHGVDPHIWTSPIEAKRMVNHIYSTLIKKYPDFEATFTKNFNRFNADIDSLIIQTTSRFAKARTRIFIVYHPALAYYARDFGLVQLSIEEEGKSPSAATVHALIKTAKREGINHILIQNQFESRNALVIAQELGGEVLSIDPLAYDWLVSMSDIGEKLTLSLNANPHPKWQK